MELHTMIDFAMRRVRAFKERNSSRARAQSKRVVACVETLDSRLLMATDMILHWNEVMLAANAADHALAQPDQKGPGKTSRAFAIASLAMFDAANAIDRQYDPYLLKMRGPKNANIDAAISQAAHDTLVALYPQQKAVFDAALDEALQDIPNNWKERIGCAVGRLAARRILVDRANDGALHNVVYTAPNVPGAFQTYPGEGAPVGPGWGSVRPFVMNSSLQFDMPPPPDLKSEAYAVAYNEVKQYGGDGVNTPTLRTEDQTLAGYFWAYDGVPGIGTPPRLYNQITRVIAEQQGNSELENARLFALVNTSMADAGVSAWQIKYDYDLWRPDRGITQIDPNGQPLDDGNPLTEADPSWQKLGAPATNMPAGVSFTPMFPAYVSGHATFGAAVFTTLMRFYHRDDISFTFVSDELNGVSKNPDGTVRPYAPRSFSSLSQASHENAQSRIYLGIHWQFDAQQGLHLGDTVADYVFEHMLQPR